MINKPHPFKGLNIRIPKIIPIQGRGFINHGPGLGLIMLPPIMENQMDKKMNNEMEAGIM